MATQVAEIYWPLERVRIVCYCVQEAKSTVFCHRKDGAAKKKYSRRSSEDRMGRKTCLTHLTKHVSIVQLTPAHIVHSQTFHWLCEELFWYNF